MDRFLSNFTHRFDAKGRISIPASFRQVLAKDGFAGVYVHPSLDAPALDCGGNALIAEIDSLLQTMPAYSQARDAFATALLGMSEVLRLNSEGRVFFEERLEECVGARLGGGVRRAGPQVPDLGAGPLSNPSRAGSGARPAHARGARRASVAGGFATSPAAPAGLGHVPVMLKEAMEALDPRAGGLYVDGTFGGGGYSRALLEAGARVIALDRDPAALRAGEALAASSGGRLQLVEARFGDLDEVARAPRNRRGGRVVLDIGVSSMQFDEAARGFSLRFDAPLDMRMGRGRPFGRRHSARR